MYSAYLLAKTDKSNKAFIDIRLRPGIATPLAVVGWGAHGPLRPMTSSIKPEVHNISQRRQQRTEPRPQRICIKIVVKIGPAVPGICSRTDKLIAILRSLLGRSSNFTQNTRTVVPAVSRVFLGFPGQRYPTKFLVFYGAEFSSNVLRSYCGLDW